MKLRLFIPCLLLLGALVQGCYTPEKVKTVDDLQNGPWLGVLLDQTKSALLEENFKGCRLLYYDDIPTMSLALDGGEIEAMIIGTPGIEDLLIEYPEFEILKDAPVLPDTASVAFRYENIQLCRQFELFSRQCWADGTMDAIYQNWFGENAPRNIYRQSQQFKSEPLVVGVSLGQSFLTLFEDEECVGFEPELMTRFAEWLGRPIKFMEVPSTGVIPALTSGKVDMLTAGLTPTKSRSRSLLFSEPFYIFDDSVIIRKTDGAKPKNSSLWDSLKFNLFEDGRFSLILTGLKNTLILLIFSLVFGLLFGATLCSAKRLGPKWLSKTIEAFCFVIGRIPLVVLLLLMFYVILVKVYINAMEIAIITYSIFFGAEMEEVFEKSISSIGKGQWEAGRLLGLSRHDIFQKIIWPQALPSAVKSFKGRAISLIENTSLVGFIALEDLTKVTDIIRSQTYSSLVPLLTVAVIYFLIAIAIGFIVDYAGEKFIKNYTK